MMEQNALAEHAADRWGLGLMRISLQQVLQKHPGLIQGAGLSLVLLGYAVPLVFPIIACVMAFQLFDVMTSGGDALIAESTWRVALLVMCASISISLWRLRVTEPAGEPLMQTQAPALYARVEELRAAFQAPPITDIHITDTTAVSVQRIPRCGYPFAFRYVLLAGMPALICLSAAQFQCLLASALGGLSVVRADIASWIYQSACMWRQYQQAVAGKLSPAALVYRVFLSGYVPLLTLLATQLDASYRVRRDRYALEVSDDDLVAQTMAAEVVMQRFMDTYYWPTVYKAAEHSATPDFKAFRNLESVFRSKLDAGLNRTWLREAFEGESSSRHQYVGLKQRLNEIGHSAVYYRISHEPSAAQVLLVASYQWIIDRCDARWAKEHGKKWSAQHVKAQKRIGQLEQLRATLYESGLFGETAVQYAALVKRYGTEQEAAEAYAKILELNPDDARINFGVGKYLLAGRDARAVEVLEHAMALDEHYVEAVCRLLSAANLSTNSLAALRPPRSVHTDSRRSTK